MPSRSRAKGRTKRSRTRRSTNTAAKLSVKRTRQQTSLTTLIQRAEGESCSLSPREVQQLQRAIGNRRVRRLLPGTVHIQRTPDIPAASIRIRKKAGLAMNCFQFAAAVLYLRNVENNVGKALLAAQSLQTAAAGAVVEGTDVLSRDQIATVPEGAAIGIWRTGHDAISHVMISLGNGRAVGVNNTSPDFFDEPIADVATYDLRRQKIFAPDGGLSERVARVSYKTEDRAWPAVTALMYASKYQLPQPVAD